MDLEIKEVCFGGEEYYQLLEFRHKWLRRPLGLEWSKLDLEGEERQFHFAAFINGDIVGAVLLKPLTKQSSKLRQMVIDDQFQGKGVGRALVEFALRKAVLLGFLSVSCHARVSAKNFYLKLGFKSQGSEFIEATVPTIKMIKSFNLKLK